MRSRTLSRYCPLLSSFLARAPNQYTRRVPLLSQSRHLFAGMKFLTDSKSKKIEQKIENKEAPEGIHGENV